MLHLLSWIVSGVTPLDSLVIRVSPELQKEAKRAGFPPFLRDKVWVYRALWRDDTLHVIVDDVLGKHEPITFAVGIKRDTVRFVEVLVYRERYGGEIRDERFLSRFRGKTSKDSLRPGKDIPRIAGATISVRSITLGVKRALWLMKKIQNE